VNQPGGGFIAVADQRLPGGKAGADAGCECVRFSVGRVGDQFNPGRIDASQEAFQEMTYGVTAQITRYQPDAQTFRPAAHCQEEKRVPTFSPSLRPYSRACSAQYARCGSRCSEYE